MTAPVSPFAAELGLRLRTVRNQGGLSLDDVAERSKGRFKAVVTGMYERGHRRITAERLVALCDFYGADPGRVLTRTPPLVAASFVAISASRDAVRDQMAARYEEALAALRAENDRLRALIPMEVVAS